MIDQSTAFFFICCSDKGSGHGILEFSTDKAGQDVTPLNLEFDEPKQRSSTLNSITGEQSLFLTVSSLRGNDILISLVFTPNILFEECYSLHDDIDPLYSRVFPFDTINLRFFISNVFELCSLTNRSLIKIPCKNWLRILAPALMSRT